MIGKTYYLAAKLNFIYSGIWLRIIPVLNAHNIFETLPKI
jgi:hypothetical protein